MKAIIIGFMGSGKTTVSRLLAQKLGCRAFDLDEYIVENERRSVKQIFEEDGEDYFRKREHELLLEILKEDAVLATGGGTPLREDNRMAMKNAGVPVILLEASSKETFERLQGDDMRPLATGLDETSLGNLKNQRRQAYEECADYAIKTDEMTPLEITEKISELL